MPPRRKAPAAKAKASPPAAAVVDNNEATPLPCPQQQQQNNEPPSAVATLFNRAQEAGTAAAAKRLADLLWSAWVARQAIDNDCETFWLELERCVSHLLVNAPQVRTGREREREEGMRERVDCSSATASNWGEKWALILSRRSCSLAYNLSSRFSCGTRESRD